MSLKEDVAAAGITVAHIVDDVFDVTPGAGLQDAPITAFFQNLNEPQFEALATLLQMPGADEDAVKDRLRTAEGAQALYAQLAQFGPPAERLFENFANVKGAERDALKPLLDMLQALGIRCCTFGRAYELAGEPDPHILFVDLKLNEDTPRIEEPILAVRNLQRERGDAHPLVFLMSSLEGPLQAERERFRTECNLFSSQFEDFLKRKLERPAAFERFLEHHVRVYRRIVALQQHVGSFKKALNEANQKLERTLRQLDLADYFALHNTAAADGLKLGGYITDLLLEYVAHEVEGSQDIGAFAKELDSWDLKDVTRSRFDIAPPVADIFEANVWYAPGRLRWERERGLGPSNGFLFLGDVFFRRSEIAAGAPKSAIVVLQPACDLIRPPMIVQRQSTILLCKGKVEPFKGSMNLSSVENLDPVILEHPENSGSRQVIWWQKKQATFWDYTELELLKQPENYDWVHVGRLRLVYALQLQRAVTADLSRVGTQRRPVTRIPQGIDVLIPHNGKWITLYSVAADPSAAAITNDKQERKRTFVLTDPVVRETFDKLEEWLVNNPTQAAVARLTALARCPEAIRALMYYTAPMETPAVHDVCPIRETALPPDQPTELRTAVAFAAPQYKLPEDGRFGNGKDLAENELVVLAFRFLQIK